MAALERSLEEIVRRHEALRTTFVTEDNEPVQKINPVTAFCPGQEDLTAVAAEQREGEARKRAQEEALRPFDLAAGPLMRARLLKLNAEEHVLLLTLHHIISDGWSMGVLFRELSALYEAFGQGDASPLPPLPVQYADYAVWQREWLTGGGAGRASCGIGSSNWRGRRRCWNCRPTGRGRAVQTFRGERRSLTLSRGAERGVEDS